jgi:hypothetical protein
LIVRPNDVESAQSGDCFVRGHAKDLSALIFTAPAGMLRATVCRPASLAGAYVTISLECRSMAAFVLMMSAPRP